jgi:hypothetical protein
VIPTDVPLGKQMPAVSQSRRPIIVDSPTIAPRANSHAGRKYLYRLDMDQALPCWQGDGLLA